MDVDYGDWERYISQMEEAIGRWKLNAMCGLADNSVLTFRPIAQVQIRLTLSTFYREGKIKAIGAVSNLTDLDSFPMERQQHNAIRRFHELEIDVRNFSLEVARC